MHDSDVVERYYNDNAVSEWERMDRHPVEFELSKRIISRFLPPCPACIADIGGGPGRYSLWLAGKGYSVTLFDLAKANIDLARSEARKQNVKLDEYRVGNIIDREVQLERGKHDMVLLMGPLYHLTSEGDRIKAVENALSLLKNDGIIVIAFISSYAPMLDALKNFPESLNGRVERYADYVRNGINIVSTENAGFTNAYFIEPSKIEGFMARFALEQLGLFSAEGILGPFEDRLKNVDEQTFESCIELGMKFIEDVNCRAFGDHLLYVGKRATKIQGGIDHVSSPAVQSR
jgi:SAM-dependent methyltransferase